MITLTHVQREELNTALLKRLAEWVDAGATEMHLDGLLDVDSLLYGELGHELTIREGVRLLFREGVPVHLPNARPIPAHEFIVTACGAKVKIQDTTASHRVNVGLRPLCSRCVAARPTGRERSEPELQNVPVGVLNDRAD